MPTLTVDATVTYGDAVTTGAVPCRLPLTFSLTYTEESTKIVQFAASVTDQVVTFDSVAAPKFLLLRSLEGDVTINISDGVVATPTPTSLNANDGWIMLAILTGQTISEIEVTTPASPTTGARVQIIAFE